MSKTTGGKPRATLFARAVAAVMVGSPLGQLQMKGRSINYQAERVSMLNGLSRYHVPVRVVTGLSRYHGPVTVTRAGHDITVPIVARCRDSLRQAARPAQAREQLAMRPMRLSPALRCKQNPGACSDPIPLSDRASGPPRNARQSTPRAPARATPADQEGPCSRRPVPEDGGTCQARRLSQGGGSMAFVGAFLAPQRRSDRPAAREPSGPVRVSRKGNNAPEKGCGVEMTSPAQLGPSRAERERFLEGRPRE